MVVEPGSFLTQWVCMIVLADRKIRIRGKLEFVCLIGYVAAAAVVVAQIVSAQPSAWRHSAQACSDVSFALEKLVDTCSHGCLYCCFLTLLRVLACLDESHRKISWATTDGSNTAITTDEKLFRASFLP